MLLVDDLGVLNTHLALRRANRDVVGDKKGEPARTSSSKSKSELFVSTGYDEASFTNDR